MKTSRHDALRAEGIRHRFANPRYIRKRRDETVPVRNTRRVERTLKLIALLSDWQTIKAMAEHLDVRPQSIHRYLNMLTELGFVVHWTSVGHYFYYRLGNTKEYFNLE